MGTTAVFSRPSFSSFSFSISVLLRMGWLIFNTWQFSGRSSNRFPSRPTYTAVLVTISSRMESMGGLVTWAKSCLK